MKINHATRVFMMLTVALVARGAAAEPANPFILSWSCSIDANSNIWCTGGSAPSDLPSGAKAKYFYLSRDENFLLRDLQLYHNNAAWPVVTCTFGSCSVFDSSAPYYLALNGTEPSAAGAWALTGTYASASAQEGTLEITVGWEAPPAPPSYDCQVPQNVVVTPSDRSATVTFTTDCPTYGIVSLYLSGGKNAIMGAIEGNSDDLVVMNKTNMRTNHLLNFVNLQPNTSYSASISVQASSKVVYAEPPFTDFSTLPDRSVYQGCYTDAVPRALPTLLMTSGATPEKCIAAAGAAGFKYAGVQWYGYCFAGNEPGFTKVPDSDCNTPCNADNTKMCGGAWRNNVYATNTTGAIPIWNTAYEGCYKDYSDIRELEVLLSDSGTTLESCLTTAAILGYPYAGLQYYNYCFAGHPGVGTKYMTKVPDSECNTPCDANKGEACGGVWRNSVYYLGSIGRLQQ